MSQIPAGTSLRDTRANKSEAIVYVVTKHINLKKLANPRYPANPRTFGQKLRKWRMDRNMLAKDIAKIIGVDETTVLNWEVRNMTPVYKFARKIKELTGVSPK